eukprot:ANDGO_08369.mRNA.1 hypothetical protein
MSGSPKKQESEDDCVSEGQSLLSQESGQNSPQQAPYGSSASDLSPAAPIVNPTAPKVDPAPPNVDPAAPEKTGFFRTFGIPLLYALVFVTLFAIIFDFVMSAIVVGFEALDILLLVLDLVCLFFYFFYFLKRHRAWRREERKSKRFSFHDLLSFGLPKPCFRDEETGNGGGPEAKPNGTDRFTRIFFLFFFVHSVIRAGVIAAVLYLTWPEWKRDDASYMGSGFAYDSCWAILTPLIFSVVCTRLWILKRRFSHRNYTVLEYAARFYGVPKNTSGTARATARATATATATANQQNIYEEIRSSIQGDATVVTVPDGSIYRFLECFEYVQVKWRAENILMGWVVVKSTIVMVVAFTSLVLDRLITEDSLEAGKTILIGDLAFVLESLFTLCICALVTSQIRRFARLHLRVVCLLDRTGGMAAFLQSIAQGGGIEGWGIAVDIVFLQKFGGGLLLTLGLTLIGHQGSFL